MAITILITSGPTREYIDPVRFISNASSGKMGKALVDEALKQNCKVIVVKGPSDIDIENSKNCKVINVVSAKDMFNAVKSNLKKTDIFIGAAAVSDYKPAKIAKSKIKKKDVGTDTLNLKLIKNPDIIKYVGNHKGEKIVVGFALESKNLLSYAKMKLKEKKLDMVVANGVKTISSKNSAPTLIFKDGKTKVLKLTSKEKVAKEIVNESNLNNYEQFMYYLTLNSPEWFENAIDTLLKEIDYALRDAKNKVELTKAWKKTLDNAKKKLIDYNETLSTKKNKYKEWTNKEVYAKDIKNLKNMRQNVEEVKHDIARWQRWELSDDAWYTYNSLENAKSSNKAHERMIKFEEKLKQEVKDWAIKNIFGNNEQEAINFYRRIAEWRYTQTDYVLFVTHSDILSPSFKNFGITIPTDPTITVRNLSSTPTTDYSNLEWGETFQKWGIAWLIDKGLSNCKNMTPWQRTSRKNRAVLWCVAWWIYWLYKFFTNKKMSFWSKALTTGWVIFASQALTWEWPLALFNKLMKWWFSADYLESRFWNLFWEAVNWVWNSGIETIAPAMYSMMIFNSSTTIWEINTMTQNFKQDNQARKTFYEESINKLSKWWTQTAEYFRVTFSDTFDEQKRNDWLASFWVVDISNQSNSDKTIYELANNASMNQIVIEKFKSENWIKVTDNKTKKEEFKQYINWLKTNNQAIDIQTLGQHKYDWFDPDWEATYTERPEDEQNIKWLEWQIDHLSLDETKKDELKRAIKKFYHERTIDTKPILSDFSLKMSDGKLILQSHDWEEAEIDIDRWELVWFWHRFTDFSELLNAADLSNKILDSQKWATPIESPAFKYRPERRWICFNNANSMRKDLITRDNTWRDIRVLSTWRWAANTAVAKTEKFLWIWWTASKIENLYRHPNEFASYLSDRREKQHTNS